MIGLIKIVKTERKNKKLRLHFVAGQQALATFQHSYEMITALCQQFNTRPEEVGRLLNQQAEQLAAAQREIKHLQGEVLSAEVQQLSTQSVLSGTVRLVTKCYANRSLNELRELAKQWSAQENLVAFLAGYEGQKLSLVVRCDQGTGVSARELLVRCLAPLAGQGSGGTRLAQGGGSATPEQVERLLESPNFFGGLNALIIAGLGDFITLDEVTDVLKTRLLANPLVKIRQIFEVHPSQFHT